MRAVFSHFVIYFRFSFSMICLSALLLGFVEMGSVLAWLGGADPFDPSTWEAAFSRLRYPAVTGEDAKAAQELLPEKMRSRVQVLEMSAMNSYENMFEEGHFLLHFSGASDKRTVTAKWAKKVRWEDFTKDEN